MVKFVTDTITMGKSKTSFNDLVKQAFAKNEKLVKTASSDEKKKDKDEAESSGQPEAEAKLTNDPKVEDKNEKKDCKCAAKKCDTKDCKCEDGCECKGGKKSCAHTKEASGSNSDDKAETSGQLKVEPLHQKGESVKPSAVTDKNKKTEVGKSTGKAETKKEDKKEAATTGRFVKLSKLNGETREMLRKYWSLLYPADYVEAMLQDK
jgi:hypothetical protein